MKKYVICIGREFCSGGKEIGKLLAEKLGAKYYDKVELRTKAREMGVEEGIFDMFDEQPTTSFLFNVVMDPYTIDSAVNEGKVIEVQRKVIQQAADEGPCVIVGRRADKILEERDDINVISVFIGADMDYRIKRYLATEPGESQKNATRFIQRKDRDRASYYNYFGDGKWGRASNYTMCFSSSRMKKEDIIDSICDYLKKLD